MPSGNLWPHQREVPYVVTSVMPCPPDLAPAPI